jgi:hypothetical protein
LEERKIKITDEELDKELEKYGGMRAQKLIDEEIDALSSNDRDPLAITSDESDDASVQRSRERLINQKRDESKQLPDERSGKLLEQGDPESDQ